MVRSSPLFSLTLSLGWSPPFVRKTGEMLGKRDLDILAVFTLGLLRSWVLESLRTTPTASELC